MTIFACYIARGTTVLAEYHASTQHNFNTITRRLLETIPSAPDSKKSYTHEGFNFNYLVEGGITYLCVSDSEGGLRVPYALLFDIANRFKATYKDKMLTAAPLAMNDTFSRVIQDRMEFFNNNKNSDKITKVKGEIDEAKNVMVKNIEKVLERGERIEMLVTKTEDLNNNAHSFRKKSTQLKRKMWWQNIKLCLLLICIVVTILLIATLIILWKLGVFGMIHHKSQVTTTGVAATSSYATTKALTSGSFTSQYLTTSPLTSSQLTTSPVTTSPLTTVSVTTNALTSGDATTGDITTNVLTTGDITTNAMTTGDITTGSNSPQQDDRIDPPKPMPDSSFKPDMKRIGRFAIGRDSKTRLEIVNRKTSRNL